MLAIDSKYKYFESVCYGTWAATYFILRKSTVSYFLPCRTCFIHVLFLPACCVHFTPVCLVWMSLWFWFFKVFSDIMLLPSTDIIWTSLQITDTYFARQVADHKGVSIRYKV